LAQRVAPGVGKMAFEADAGFGEFDEVKILQEIAVKRWECKGGFMFESVQVGICYNAGYWSPSNPAVGERNGCVSHRVGYFARRAHEVVPAQLSDRGIDEVGDYRIGHV